MKYRIAPSKISGTVCAPPSKSETHREMILSALSSGTSVLHNPLISYDTEATLSGIQALGAVVSQDGDTLRISGGNLHAADTCIDCKNSGTTLRLLAGVAARLSGTTRFTGDSSLMHRPMQPLLSALESCGAGVSVEGDCISVTGPVTSGAAKIRGDVSSQFVSSLLLAGISVRLTTPLVSAPYADMTVSSLVKRGVPAAKTGDRFSVPRAAHPSPREVFIGGDWTSAAYLLTLGALCGTVTVTGLNPGSLQGDVRITSILRSFGADVSFSGNQVTVSKTPLSRCSLNLSDTPDIFPAAAVLAARAEGISRIYGVSQQIYKESNRLSEVSSLLSVMGAKTALQQDCFAVEGGKLRGAEFFVPDDHRLFMAAVLAGLCAEETTEIDASNAAYDEVYAVSYPDFLRDVRLLGGNIE
ncbi:MAG: 3-phosphoshikimate 1-carboxyvinyltransferase [Methanocorpusculum sp.]|nr:3-phosphoshikimate 1-carboxyvinyltransferase [Methanocorpusculum sp.]